MPQVIMAAAEGEHAIFNNTLSTIGSTDGKHRGSVLIQFPSVMFYQVPTGTESDDMWFHILHAKEDGAVDGSLNSRNWLTIQTSSGVTYAAAGQIQRVGTLNWVTKTTTNAAGSLANGPTVYAGAAQEFVDVDVRIRISTGTNPNDTLTVDWYVRQQLRETYTVVDAAGFDRPTRLILGANDTSSMGDFVYQDVIVTDGVPTVGMELVTMTPSAVGFYGSWVNNYTNIDEVGFDFNDLIYTTAAGTRETWIYNTPTFDASDKIIYAFVSNVVVQADLAGVVSDFQPFLRIAATDYAGTNVGADNLSPKSFINIWTQNPNTLAPWAESDFDGLESGVLAV